MSALNDWKYDDLRNKLRDETLFGKVTMYKDIIAEIDAVGVEHFHLDKNLTIKKKELEELFDKLEDEKMIIALEIANSHIK